MKKHIWIYRHASWESLPDLWYFWKAENGKQTEKEFLWSLSHNAEKQKLYSIMPVSEASSFILNNMTSYWNDVVKYLEIDNSN